MKINVASGNPVKVNAVREILQNYPHLAGYKIVSFPVSSDVSEQPKTLEETSQGAMNRAKKAFQNCDYSVGIESGFIDFPSARTGHMELSIGVIYDGENYFFGFSPAFECPLSVMEHVNRGLDLNQACYAAGLSDNHQVGSEQGIVGILTKGRKTRMDYAKDALIMALMHLEE